MSAASEKTPKDVNPCQKPFNDKGIYMVLEDKV
jgi:hypothetical protein